MKTDSYLVHNYASLHKIYLTRLISSQRMIQPTDSAFFFNMERIYWGRLNNSPNHYFFAFISDVIYTFISQLGRCVASRVLAGSALDVWCHTGDYLSTNQHLIRKLSFTTVSKAVELTISLPFKNAATFIAVENPSLQWSSPVIRTLRQAPWQVGLFRWVGAALQFYSGFECELARSLVEDAFTFSQTMNLFRVVLGWASSTEGAVAQGQERFIARMHHNSWWNTLATPAIFSIGAIFSYPFDKIQTTQLISAMQGRGMSIFQAVQLLANRGGFYNGLGENLANMFAQFFASRLLDAIASLKRTLFGN